MFGRGAAGRGGAVTAPAASQSRLVGPPRISRPVRRRLKHGLMALVLGGAVVGLFAPEVVEDARRAVLSTEGKGAAAHPRAPRSLISHKDDAQIQQEHSADKKPKGWGNNSLAEKVVHLGLDLPEKYRSRPEFASKESTYKHWGFDLRTSNKLPIDRTLPDHRSAECKAIKYPDVHEMPSVSVIIIHFNEPLSTLLRNIISVINNSPSALLGEIVLVDDNSTLDELSELQKHVDAINAQTTPNLIRTFRRSEHTGIVGARIRGAQEARHDIIIFLDSHCETLPGWLEPMVARIHENSRRVIVPNIRGFHLDTLEVFGNPAWPPSKGVMSWRVNFVPIAADLETDLLDPAHPFTSPVRNPVMPGGLFAMSRKWFWESGAYDPELLYYGAEHVEMSVRLWMCGGTMESLPCSNVGHIYREFNRFDNVFDPLIKNVHIGKVLNRNDARVAAVWLDQYRSIFTRMRLLDGLDLGPNLRDRIDLRQHLQCRSFKWYIENVMGPGFYIPDLDPPITTVRVAGGGPCLRTNGHTSDSPAPLSDCVDPAKIQPHDVVGGSGDTSELWSFTADGHLQSAFMQDAKEFVCLRTTSLEMTGCAEAVQWDVEKLSGGVSRIRLHGTDQCMARRLASGDPAAGTIQKCNNSTRQLWRWDPMSGDIPPAGVLLGADMIPGGAQPTSTGAPGGMCLDNMQRTRGGVGYYGCHRGATQQWRIQSNGKIQAASGADACLGVAPRLSQYHCAADDREQLWRRVDSTIRPVIDNSLCLTSSGSGKQPLLSKCSGSHEQKWEFQQQHIDMDLGVRFPSRYN